MNILIPEPAIAAHDPGVKPYRPAVAALLNARRPAAILDAPSGAGWLPRMLDYEAQVDGIDLYADTPLGYRHFAKHDMNLGLPARPGAYDCVVMSEVVAALENPGLLFASARQTLKPGGLLVVSTPNTWHPAARAQFLLRGFFPGYPPYAGRIQRGITYMHLLHWSWPQLFLFLRLAGFEDIRLHPVAEPTPKHAWEIPLGWPQRLYCGRRLRKAANEEEARFWEAAGSRQAVYGRRLVVSATVPKS